MIQNTSIHGDIRILSSSEPGLLQDRINDFLGTLAENIQIIDMKYSTAQQGNHTNYSVLLHYKAIEVEW